jgi:N6-adenosine-specific RNA methylase IME4
VTSKELTVNKKLPPPVKISDISRELAKIDKPEEAIDLGDRLSRAERIMRDSGMYEEDELREVNEYRMRARWKLGKLLKQLPQHRVAGPGRGKKKKNKAKTNGGRPRLFSDPSKVESLQKLQLDSKAATQAQRISAMPLSEQDKSFKSTRADETLNSYASQAKWARPWWYQESRVDRHQDIADAAEAISVKDLGPFPLLYADPPTKFATFSEKGLERTPDQHYPTLTWDQVADFKVHDLFVREIAMKTAALLMWCTSSNQHHALKVMEAWGFEFKASAAWVKTKSDGKSIWTGTGLIFRNAHEILLYGTRGNMPGPQWQPPSAFLFPRGRHSEKPPQVRKMIERMYPAFKDERTRCELFARGQFKGWTCHGLEALSEAAQ